MPQSSIGHLLGAAGAVETIITALSVFEVGAPTQSARSHVQQLVPPTHNVVAEDIDVPGIAGALVMGSSRQQVIRAALCNSFGFGGVNASVLLTHPDL